MQFAWLTRRLGAKWTAALVACVILAAAIGLVSIHRRAVLKSRVWRIGVDNSLPYHLLRPDGTVGGYTAEAVDVAARRIGLRCVWKRINVDAAQALREGQIDIFPDLTDLPSRRDGKIHFSAPWLQNEYCLLKLKNTNLNNIESTRNRTISFFGRFVLETVVRRYLPGIQPLRVGSTESHRARSRPSGSPRRDGHLPRCV